MGKCDNCRLRKESEKAFDIHWLGEDDCPYDKCPVSDFPKTNADRIRSMTDEELADKLEEIQLKTVKAYGNDDLLLKGELKKYWLDWLKEEVDTNDS